MRQDVRKSILQARKSGRAYSALLYVGVLGCVMAFASTPWWKSFDPIEEYHPLRHLASSASCDHGSLKNWQKNGGVALYVVGILYMFVGIGIVCDDFFVASLEAISEALNLSEDVAGATFMAAGSSAPELFSSIVAISSPSASEELGVGTIVGSAVFNILMIIGATAVSAGKPLDLDWWPLSRDAVFYFTAVMSILAVFMDGEVHWYEGMVFFLLYMVYIGFMAFNEQIASSVRSLVCRQKIVDCSTSEGPEADKGALNPRIDGDEDTGCGDVQAAVEDVTEDDEEDSSPFTPPESWKDYPYWILSVPWYLAFTYTIPPCQNDGWSKYYILSFLMSIVWIGGISWFMVEWAAAAGCILHIPNVVMGVTVLAAGTSIPDCIASLVVAKQGMGDMAIANAIGSNIFDIWLGLGAPWMIILAIQKRKLEMDKDGLLTWIFILLGVLVSYFGCIMMSGWRITPRTGYVLITLYVGFAAFNIITWILSARSA